MGKRGRKAKDEIVEQNDMIFDSAEMQAKYDALTEKQQLWLDAYVVSRNATQAVKVAGYRGSPATLTRMGSTNKSKLADLIEWIDANAKEVVELVHNLEGIYRFWGDTMLDGKLAPKDRLKASELLARALGAFDGENETNVNIIESPLKDVPTETLEKYMLGVLGATNKSK